METIDMLINEIESEVLKAKKAAFSNTDIVINKGVLLDLISRFRASYPLVLREATQIKKERDDIIAKAEAYANDTMDKAEAKAKQMMTETEIYNRAKAVYGADRAVEKAPVYELSVAQPGERHLRAPAHEGIYKKHPNELIQAEFHHIATQSFSFS